MISTQQSTTRSSNIRLAELMGALSVATDIGTGQPLEFALQSCVLAMRLGAALHWSDEALREIYYQALLRYIGCNVETHLLSAIVGDEQAYRGEFAGVDAANGGEVMKLTLRYMRTRHAGESGLNLIRELARGVLSLPQVRASFLAHCEVAQRLAGRFGFDGNVVYALGQLYERWDGEGQPRGIKGEAIAPAVLVVTLAQDALLFYRVGGSAAAIKVARERRGRAYAPHVADCFIANAEKILGGLDEEPTWEMVLSLEPGARKILSDDELDNACRAMADFVDIKSPYTANHSSGVAALAAQAARNCHLPASDVARIQRAGLLHDLGRTAVPSSIWDKPAPLTEREWERVRLHPYHTERILARPALLARIGDIAALHHERLDGSGYYRRLPAMLLPQPARILAAADAYHALIEPRPHRVAFAPEVAAEQLKREVRSGRLDGDAVHAVLEAAGHRVRAAHTEDTAGLSEREVEVLRLIARALTTKQIANALVISPKTADHHIQHIYNKIGVSTRAGATLYAMEHDLIEHTL